MNVCGWSQKRALRPGWSVWGLLLLVVLGVGLGGCAGEQEQESNAAATPSLTPHSATLTPAPTLTPTATPPLQADVWLTEAQNQQPLTVQVGQIINLAYDPEYEWAISYRAEILLALKPAETMSQPGADGWFFRVIAPGTTEIVLESQAAPCPDNTPCMPNILRFVFPIEAIP